jgi:hypothetical protein
LREQGTDGFVVDAPGQAGITELSKPRASVRTG